MGIRDPDYRTYASWSGGGADVDANVTYGGGGPPTQAARSLAPSLSRASDRHSECSRQRLLPEAPIYSTRRTLPGQPTGARTPNAFSKARLLA